MSDADFFRLLVAELIERARELPRFATMGRAVDSIADNNLDLARATSPAEQLEILISIAALCERAAVDLTIPASRAKKKHSPQRKK